MRLFLVLLVASSLAGCGGRELGWLVPRASVGVVLRASETGVATDAYVTIGAPLSGPEPRALEQESARTPRQLHLLGRGPRCRLAPLCRWEATERSTAFRTLAQEESP
jgi:hypothetical protein